MENTLSKQEQQYCTITKATQNGLLNKITTLNATAIVIIIIKKPQKDVNKCLILLLLFPPITKTSILFTIPMNQNHDFNQPSQLKYYLIKEGKVQNTTSLPTPKRNSFGLMVKAITHGMDAIYRILHKEKLMKCQPSITFRYL